MPFRRFRNVALALLLLTAAGRKADLYGQPGCGPEKPVGNGEPPVAAQRELSELRGTWELTGLEQSVINGNPQPPRERKVIVAIRDGKLIIPGEALGVGRLELTLNLDPQQEPKVVDLVSPKLGTLLGIYRLDGDALTFYADVGKRPAAFPTEPDPRVWNLRRLSRVPTSIDPAFPNAPGTYWIVEPTPPPARMATLGVVLVYETDRDGATVITLAGAAAASPRLEYQPVLLDAAKKRYLPAFLHGEGLSSSRGPDGAVVAFGRWRMDPDVLPAKEASMIGVEAMTPEFHRAAAQEALRQAKAEGIEVLQYPELDKPFEFTITTIDGKKQSRAGLRGKVVIIDCWASWCAPCMALLPEIKELYQKHHKDGLDVIGVNFDNDVEEVQATCERLGLHWPQAMAPTEDKQRELWQEASGISSLPRILVIDRDGVLRLDLNGKIDPNEVAKLLHNP